VASVALLLRQLGCQVFLLVGVALLDRLGLLRRLGLEVGDLLLQPRFILGLRDRIQPGLYVQVRLAGGRRQARLQPRLFVGGALDGRGVNLRLQRRDLVVGLLAERIKLRLFLLAQQLLLRVGRILRCLDLLVPAIGDHL
jgi:hypothetical protein